MRFTSDMMGFPDSGLPVLRDSYDGITLGTLYSQPLKANNFILVIFGNNRLLGDLTLGGAVTGVSTLTMNGLLSGVSDITMSGSVYLTTGNIYPAHNRTEIGTVIRRVKKAWMFDLDTINTPTVSGEPLARIQDVLQIKQSLTQADIAGLRTTDNPSFGNINATVGLAVTGYGSFATAYVGDVDYSIHVRPDFDTSSDSMTIISWGNDDQWNYSGKPFQMEWDHTTVSVAFTDGDGNNLQIKGLSTNDAPAFNGLTLSNDLNVNFGAWNDQVYLDWGTQEFKIRNYLETNKQVTLDCNTYLYIMAQSVLCGYFTSSGFNMIDDKGMVLGSPGSTKINSIWGTTNGQRTTANVAPYRQTGILAVADVDYSAPNYVAGRAWIICDGSDRSYNFAHDVMANPTLFIQSANQSQTEWIGFNHNQTNGVISTGAGKVVIASPTGLEIGTGAAGVDYTLTFNGETTDGLVTWKEDEDYFEFNDGIMLANAEEIFFANSTSIKIYSSAGDTLDFSATNINASGTFKATSYKSSDGSTGATGTFTGGLGETITVKNGLVTDIGAVP